ncbi:MAG TPA: hypothetical protein DEA96_00950 [Leptospiraceae bacterium]|nr:hypothetical protein [Spirochaetaceae bacterium]HBS03500.1 hypothetical protein [Leptospiraceae bacterium]|tara:strand:- start:15525 stop:15980 length:456 start_codon:yes stop_codon:yes gene_type:complete
MRIRTYNYSPLLSMLVFGAMASGCFLEPDESEWDKGDEIFYNALILQLASQPVAPRVRFLNNSGGTDSYRLFTNSGCSGNAFASFSGTASGQYTAYYQTSSFYLNIDTSECVAGQFNFGQPGTALNQVQIDCEVSLTQIQCNDSSSTTIAR